MKAGVTFRELLKIGLAVGHYPEAAGREEEWLEQRMALHFSGRSTHEQRLADGRWFRIEERRTGDGGILSVIEDITELKQREALLRLMFENNPVPMWVVDAGDAGASWTSTRRRSPTTATAAAVPGHGAARHLRPSEHEACATRAHGSNRRLPGERSWKHRSDGPEIHVRPTCR
jgi:PAS domain-containing protein